MIYSPPIEIRAWSHVDKQMLDWTTINQSAFNQQGVSLLYDILVAKKSNFEIMCFTGKTGYHNEKIFGGDIVQIHMNLDHNSGSKIYHVVHYYEAEWRTVDVRHYCQKCEEHTKPGIKPNIKSWMGFKVVGNIFQNPEFLIHKGHG